MRMRKKAWARPELNKCLYFIKDPTSNKGKWKEYFANNNPINLELGCGKGSFISQIANKNRDVNFIAVDIKDDMLGYARRKIEVEYGDNIVKNVALLAYDIERIGDIFSKEDIVDRIYINFCNPWPRPKHRKRRLTHTRQLEKYKLFLKDGGQIHFKTDDNGLYMDTLTYFKETGFEIIQNIEDLALSQDADNIVTEHEQMFMDLGVKIKKIVASKM